MKSDILFQDVSASLIDGLCVNWESGPKQKSEESEERERENGKVIDKRERERDRERREWEKEFFHFFVFNIFFFPSDTPSLGCQHRISGVFEHTHQTWSWRGSQRCKEWECVRVPHTEEEMWDMCDLLTDVWLGVCVATFADCGKIYLSHFSPLLSLSHSFILLINKCFLVVLFSDLVCMNLLFVCLPLPYVKNHWNSYFLTKLTESACLCVLLGKTSISPEASWVCVLCVLLGQLHNIIYFFYHSLNYFPFSQWYLFNFPY